MEYPAHIRADRNGAPLATQSVEAHCRNVARETSHLLAAIGLENCGELLGYLHDMGKFTPEFKHYIEQASRGDSVVRGSVNHTFAGVRLLLEQFHGQVYEAVEDAACELLAAALGSHHGWFDCIGPQGEDGFSHRLEKNLPSYATACEQFLSRCMSHGQLEDTFEKAAGELSQCFEKISDLSVSDDEVSFYCAMLCRIMASALIDADRRDTAQFMSGVPFPVAQPAPWDAVLQRVEQRIGAMPGSGAVNAARRSISDTCAACAALPSGIHRLSVPTGGGKTLTALRFALRKTAAASHRRIFFVIPLLSVLEQNAAVIHDFVGDDSLILEHHSNLLQTENKQDELDRAELLTETWDSPIVITTLVQLLNTLFEGKTACVRRMQALADSVIVIDEVQTVPSKLLSQFNLALNFLAQICGAEIVLCSATQPCLEKADHALLYSTPAELVPWSEALWVPFCRTRMIDSRRPGGCSLEDITAQAKNVLAETDSLLIICNLKAQALSLYESLKGSGATVFHLSTSMCMAHRQQTLAAINQALRRTPQPAGEKVICVATQLVEAGVDFSFGCVIRLLAGMDNAVQAAGRCNRGGEYPDIRPVYLAEVRGERLGPLKEIQQAQNATKNLLETFARDNAAFDNNLSSAEAIRFYYTDLFGNRKGTRIWDYPLPKLSTYLYDLLAENPQFSDHCDNYADHWMHQAFKTAGEQFKVFDENTTDVLVPYGEGADCIAALNSERARYDIPYCAAILQKAKPYTISLYENQLRRLLESGGVIEGMAGKVLMLSETFYNQETGVCITGNSGSFLEV